MQSTYIKIRFTPLIRHLQNDNTKCSLEIVPNISCIQNLDKIEWNGEYPVEYSVPVIYKIILKKDTHDNLDVIKKQDKIYYSCIDLHLLSTNSSLACGDINKVNSDNYIQNKFHDNFENTETVYKKYQNDTELEDSFRHGNLVKARKTKQLNDKKLYLNPLKKGDDVAIIKHITRDHIDTLPNLKRIDFAEGNKTIKEKFNEYTIPTEIITDKLDILNNKNKKRELTLTSICTLNTNESPAYGAVYNEAARNNSKICLKQQKKNIKNLETTQPFEIFPDRRFYTEIDKKYLVEKFPCKRILPELRVTHFMMSVEHEILPLKLLLNEIYRKCASQGLLWNALQEPIPTPYPLYTNKIKFFNSNQRKPKCNRVVYSIVFEE